MDQIFSISFEKKQNAPFFLEEFCDSSPCLNGGTCVEEEDDFRCRCTDKYEGKICDVGKFFS